jgi:glycosyltransferase involved in cell wall biosynthesis
MLTGARFEPIHYNPRQTAGFEQRISQLCARERRIAYFYEVPDVTTFRYRVLNMIEALSAAPSCGISASWFTRADLAYFDRFVDRAHALVICRTRYDTTINRMISYARARSVRVIFDIDDLIFDPDYVHLLLHTLDLPQDSQQAWDVWFAAVARLGATLRLCDRAIVPNRFLAEHVSRYAPSVAPAVIPNYLNRLQQEISEKIWCAKRNSHFARDDRIHLGYFSGTPTHNRDFEIASTALAKILDQDRRIVLRIVGFMDLKGPLLEHRDRIEMHPFQDFLNLQRLTGEVEINLAPLQINTFTNCKSELKYFEAAIVGTPTIASPTFAFRSAISDGKNGFLACAHQWETKIRTALDSVDESDCYTKLAECAYLHASETYNWNRYASDIALAIFGHPTEIGSQNLSAFSMKMLDQATKAANADDKQLVAQTTSD